MSQNFSPLGLILAKIFDFESKDGQQQAKMTISYFFLTNLKFHPIYMKFFSQVNNSAKIYIQVEF